MYVLGLSEQHSLHSHVHIVYIMRTHVHTFMCSSILKAPSGFFDLTIHKTIPLSQSDKHDTWQMSDDRMLDRNAFVIEISDNKMFFHLLEYS